LCFFVPIIDAAIRARPLVKAAHARNRHKELEKFIDQSGLPERLRPTFARLHPPGEPGRARTYHGLEFIVLDELHTYRGDTCAPSRATGFALMII
jgi:hypothetical protein